ncbi:Putative membrane-anchored cell surface protein [Burkholderia gladioli BSR3]|uniref:Putative membrane-anchored cell surface protein n=1 Tax=Burkholderia gladioli (strain BSR3) TaxID=999541 RepID=F2LJP6_BURGS|nr:Putative membrane-anchored cell surface protein [Burkholderia gladioli BSR3]
MSTSVSSIANSSGKIGNSVASALGGGSTYDPATGTLTAPTYTTYKANGTTANVNNVGDALDSINSNGIKYFHTNSTGADSIATGVDSVAIGPNAVANIDNSVAIGSGSITTTAVPVSSATVGGITFGNFAGSSPAGTVNIGAPGFERQLTGLAAGRISATSTDAVNGSQLFQTNAAVASLSSSLSSAAGAFSSSVASLSTSASTSLNALSSSTSTSLSSLSTGVSTTNSSVSSLSTSTSTTTGSLSTGLSNTSSSVTSLSTATSTSIGSLSTSLSSTNNSVTSLSSSLGTVSAQVASLSTTAANNTTRSLSAGGYAADMSAPGAQAPSVSAGSNSVALGQGSTDGGRSNVVSVGSSTQQRQITNVAAGTEGTDAVNLNQLNALSTSMSQSFSGQQSQLNLLGSQLAQTQQAVQQTNQMARQGIAAATALTMLPQVEPGKTVNMAIGVARFAGESGMAFGASAHVTTNGILKLGIGVSGQNKTYGVGYGYSW